ncbi:myb-like DNA-binding protein bas1 [Coemansia sp. RSA 552]|nr:myb-like DNA-binding protein bas1 [Coemansia sp. RSA 552]
MDVAELRQTMLDFVRMRKMSRSPLSLSPTHSIHSGEPPSPSLLPPQMRKRHRNGSDASSASHRIGIDLLLNASTISDRMDICNQASPSAHIPSPTEDGCHAMRRTRPLPPITQLAGLNGTESASSRATPPLVQEQSSTSSSSSSSISLSSAANRASAQPMSAPADGPFRMSAVDVPSLHAYKISSTPAKPGTEARCSPGISYASSYPPPYAPSHVRPSISHGRTSVSQHPSPPESQDSSPTAIIPSRGPQCASSPGSGVMPIPSSAITMLPPTSDTVVCPELYHGPAPPRSPTIRGGIARQQHHHHHHHHPYQQAPPLPQQQQQGFSPMPPTSPRSAGAGLYAHAQGYFASRGHSSPHLHQAAMVPAQPGMHPHAQHHIPPPPPPPPPLPQQQQQQQSPPCPMPGVHLTSPASVPMPMVRSQSKPKFNYAFLETKRPRGPSSRWTPDEDTLLKRAVKQFGEDRQWVKVAQQVPGRTNLQCRQRWLCNIKAQVERERNAAASKK